MATIYGNISEITQESFQNKMNFKCNTYSIHNNNIATVAIEKVNNVLLSNIKWLANLIFYEIHLI